MNKFPYINHPEFCQLPLGLTMTVCQGTGAARREVGENMLSLRELKDRHPQCDIKDVNEENEMT